MHQHDTTSSIYAYVKKGRSVWQQSNTCRLVVSVGRPNHEGDKLTATIQWVNKHYENCIFVLCDVLHRHNYMASGFSPEEAYAMSKNDGDVWLECNEKIIKNLLLSHKIIRWEHCLNHTAFPGRLKNAKDLYDENAQLRASINDDIFRFINTQKKRRILPYEEESKMRIKGKDLLLEEIAGCSIIIEETEAVDVYPGSELKAMKFFRENNVSLILPSLKQRAFARIDFNRRKTELQQAA